MEMPLQGGEREGEELCVSECVSQTVLAVAVSVALNCVRVQTQRREYCVCQSGVVASVSMGRSYCLSFYLK